MSFLTFAKSMASKLFTDRPTSSSNNPKPETTPHPVPLEIESCSSTELVVTGPPVQVSGPIDPEVTVDPDEIQNLEIEVSGLESSYTAIKARHDALAS